MKARRIAPTLLVLAALAATQAKAASCLPTDARYDAAVTISTAPGGLPLKALLEALGTSVKLAVVSDSIPDKRPDFLLNGKPFRQVWDLLVATNSLDCELLPNDVILVGPPAFVNTVRRPAAPPAQPAAQAVERRTYQVHGDAAAIQAFLAKVVPGATVTPVPGNKVLLIDATATQHNDIGSLLKLADPEPAPVVVAQVETPAPQPAAPVVERRTYNLKGDAASVTDFLNKAVPGATITPVPGGKAILVDATAAQQQEIERLLVIADIPKVEAAPTPPAPAPERRSYTVKSNASDLIAFFGKAVPAATITVMPGGRGILVDATPAQQQEIERLLAQVDVPAPVVSAPTLVRRVFPISNSKAGKLAEVLTKAVQGTVVTTTTDGTTTTTATSLPTSATVTGPETTTATSTAPNAATRNTATGAPNATLTITADEQGNNLIVSGLPEQVQQIADLLPILDKRQQIVNIGVRIEEVNEGAGRNLGIDWSAVVGNFATRILETGLSLVFDATRSVASANIGAAINALETQNLARTIHDGSLPVLNNGTGSLRRGGRIELNIPSSAGNITKTLEFGVLLGVAPQVAADGTITVNVKAEVSDVANAESVNPNRIDFTSNATDTTVTLRDGQSLLLGSLLTTTTSSVTSGVPILSSIPLIGDLFKRTNVSNGQKELLIILTANIIK